MILVGLIPMEGLAFCVGFSPGVGVLLFSFISVLPFLIVYPRFPGAVQVCFGGNQEPVLLTLWNSTTVSAPVL